MQVKPFVNQTVTKSECWWWGKREGERIDGAVGEGGRGGLWRDKTRDEKWNGRCNRWRLGDNTGQSFLKGREWPWVMGDGNNEEPAPFISALFQMRWKVMKQTELVSLYLYDFYIWSWMGPKEKSGQHILYLSLYKEIPASVSTIYSTDISWFKCYAVFMEGNPPSLTL